MTVGVVDIDITGSSTVTLTTNNGAADQARNAILELTGVLGANIELHIPSVDWKYSIRGAWTGGFTVTVKISGSGTEIVMSTGDILSCYTNGTDIYQTTAESTDLTGRLLNTNNLSDVSSTTTSRTNLGLGDSATQDVADILALVYPVGSLYFNASVATNPATLLGFGTWVAEAEGRVILGVGTGTDDNAVDGVYTLGLESGEYEHILTVAEIPEMDVVKQSAPSVNYEQSGFNTGAGTPQNGMKSTNSSDTARLITPGGDEAHNNTQPSFAIHIWKRTA